MAASTWMAIGAWFLLLLGHAKGKEKGHEKFFLMFYSVGAPDLRHGV